MTTTTTIVQPADAMKLFPWEDDNGTPVRPFTGSSWRVTVDVDGSPRDIDVTIEGQQFASGNAERAIFVNGDDQVCLTPQRARELADVLNAAADEIERFEASEQ